MLTSVAAIAAIAAAGYVVKSDPGDDSAQPQHQYGRNSEQREAMHTGFLRPANRATAVLDSEEMRAIRPARGSVDPRTNAAEWQQHHFEKNDKLGEMYSYGRALDNLKILRYNYSKKPGLLQLPNKEGFAEFASLPNAFFDRLSGEPTLDERVDLYRDPFGNAGGAPLVGRSNVVLNKLYVGNAWGPGGQQFEAVGNGFRDPGYADKKPDGILRNTDADAGLPSVEKLKRRVQFK